VAFGIALFGLCTIFYKYSISAIAGIGKEEKRTSLQDSCNPVKEKKEVRFEKKSDFGSSVDTTANKDKIDRITKSSFIAVMASAATTAAMHGGILCRTVFS
jgi:hypothetical protein